jgi:hypothetical protein
LAEAEKAPYIYLNDPRVRKENYIKTILQERGEHPGLVAVLSCLEVDNSFDIYKNSKSCKLELISKMRKCLHIYFYFIDSSLGLCYFRIQTFFPFKTQIYFNGRERLARQLNREKVDYVKDDNCFTWISDFDTIQKLCKEFHVATIHKLFDQWADQYVPILAHLKERWNISYHWSIRQMEYATDIIFKTQNRLEILYEQLIKHAVMFVLPEDLLSFLGKKRRGRQGGRIETSCKKTYLGYRIKHKNGATVIKIYNKAGNVLRIEITFNNVSELKAYREVQQKDGRTVKKLAVLKKSIYSTGHLVRIAKAVTKRYVDFLSKMEDNSKSVQQLRDITERKTENQKNYKGFNPLNRYDSILFEILLNGAFIANGFTNKKIKLALVDRLNQKWNTAKVSRLFKRLRVFGLIKRVHKSYKYFLTEKGRILTTLAVKLKNIVAIPAFDSLSR